MNKAFLFFTIAFALFLSFEFGSAIKCYQCNSYFQQDCADHFNNITHHLQNCDEGVTMCRKIVQMVYYADEWNTRYIRQCAPHGEVGGREGRECVDRTGTYKVKMRYCHCNNQDGCNTAAGLNYPTTIFMLCALSTISFFLAKLL